MSCFSASTVERQWFLCYMHVHVYWCSIWLYVGWLRSISSKVVEIFIKMILSTDDRILHFLQFLYIDIDLIQFENNKHLL